MQRLEQLFSRLEEQNSKTVAVVQPEDQEVLQAFVEALSSHYSNLILYGNKRKIEKKAKKSGIILSSPSVAFVESTEEDGAEEAVTDIAEDKEDVLMKGMVLTRTLLRAVLRKENGIRGHGIISHTFLFEILRHDGLLMLTDAA